MAAHPASSLAALASYWVTHTAQQLDFEQAHHQSCLRVRIEDLVARTAADEVMVVTHAHDIAERIRKVKIDELRPIEALQLLSDLQRDLKS